MSCEDGISWHHGQRLLINRNVEAAVFEHDPISIVEEGLAYDRCDFGIVTDSDHVPGLERHDLTDPEHRFKVLRTQVDVVLPHGAAILNAADEQVLDMARLCDGEVLLYAEDEMQSALVAHRAKGGRAVFCRGSQIVQARGGEVTTVLDVRAMPAQGSGALPREVLMAGVACAWAMGMAPDVVAMGIETFERGTPAERRANGRAAA